MTMTLQEIFDKVVARAAVPVRSMRAPLHPASDGLCAYRPDDYPATPGCFVGCVIEDAHYHRALETLHVYEGVVMEALFKSGVLSTPSNVGEDVNRLSLLDRCQRVHDRVKPENWMTALHEVAAEYRLAFNPPVTDEVKS